MKSANGGQEVKVQIGLKVPKKLPLLSRNMTRGHDPLPSFGLSQPVLLLLTALAEIFGVL